jgi:hypothetical protein
MRPPEMGQAKSVVFAGVANLYQLESSATTYQVKSSGTTKSL